MTLHDLFSPRHRRFVRGQASQPGLSLGSMAWRRFRRNGLAVASLVVIGLFAMVALLGYIITPDSTPHCNQQYLELATLPPGSKATFICFDPKPSQGNIFTGRTLPYTAVPIVSSAASADCLHVVPVAGEPFSVHNSRVVKVHTRTFWLGTDTYGRDVLSMLMIGSRVSLSVGLIAILIALAIGVTLGALAAYFGGWVDNLITWLINVVWAIPTVLLVIAITFALGKGFWQVFVAVGLTMWVDIARVVRGQVYSIKEKEYVEAARALGFGPLRIIFRHILPNITGPIIVVTASNFASAILLEAGLSFLGIGVQPPMPSWGTMVKENYSQILLDSAYLALLPGAAIMFIVLAFMLLGNGVRDALDIKN